jgi:2-polyprenyl-6-methoxyphenol hydroxylase-like FAD-dependent oxidoreductase
MPEVVECMTMLGESCRSWTATIGETVMIRSVCYPLYAFPADQTWKTRPGLTIIGDAAHVMPPFLGEGANMAMLDAVELADRLLSNERPSLGDALAAFERRMHERMAPLIRRSIETQDLLFAPDAPAGLVAIFQNEEAPK